MGCYHPIPAWRGDIGESGRRSVLFKPPDSRRANQAFSRVVIPCGTCIGCRLAYAREWAVRCTHEAQGHLVNSFVTFTYADENLYHVNGRQSLCPEDMIKFLQKLRDKRGPFRYFQCGEYGDISERPHHHALLFGVHFRDRRYLKDVGGGKLYTSKELDALWGKGQCSIGDVSFESAGYIARYTLKKCFKVMQLHGRVKEYLTMSNRPGLGYDWANKYWMTWYRNDFLTIGGNKFPIPRYYDKIIDRIAPQKLREAKYRRRMQQQKVEAESWDYIFEHKGEWRNNVKEQVKEKSLEFLRRTVEE